ncbi:aspartate/glutamate racemase family protein [Bacillus chungangensis]|uniref:Asp/Glu/hydantoin racemase n=1 Tax=Bacillus chungangensis TaxID=587633 RepID=A0ABT9WXW2_9BACI|nr:aspartate/glutamate racemase family protein [Bacillus chungangensis]MDQ0178131.1 Asp/Glu/hydantoin racemase [Bacillus chungangensis]
MKVGIIRVFTTEDPHILYEHGRLMKENHGIETITRCIDDQPNGIYDAASEQQAIPKIVALAKKMEIEDGVSIITISCAADPALEECRKAVAIPVLGAGSCGALTALMMSGQVGVLGITQDAPKAIANYLGDKMIKHLTPKGVSKTTDLLTEQAAENAVAAAKELLDAGATSILYACTGFSTIGLSKTLSQHVNVPIIDLVDAQALAAITMMRGKAYEPKNI